MNTLMSRTKVFCFLFICLLSFTGCKKTTKKIGKELLKENAYGMNKKYVSRAVGERIAQNAIREQVETKMKKEGIKSYLAYGINNAERKIAYSPASKIEKQISKKSEKKFLELSANKSQKYVKHEGLKALEVLKKKHPEYAKQIEKIAINPNTKTDINKFVVEETKDGLVISHKEWPKSKCIIQDNVIRANAGSLPGKIGAQNEFLNNLLPNKTYIVDRHTIYKTDYLGRVISVESKRNEILGISRAGRNSKTQSGIVKEMDGKEGFDDGGHLISCSTGGANEKINQVPMNRDINRQGKWRKMEEMEEKALKEGKTVFSKREPLYKGNSKRPYAIKTTTIIDGKKYTQVIKNP